MSGEQKKRGMGGWVFLVLVLIGYGLLSLVKPESTKQAFVFFIQVFHQILPILGLVFILLFVTNMLLEPKRIRRYLGKESGIKGWISAVLGGILSVGSIYVWYTMLDEMRQKGMRTALIATFLYSRAVKLPLLPLMIHYFGMAYTLVLSLYLIVFSIISGVLVEKLTRQKVG